MNKFEINEKVNKLLYIGSHININQNEQTIKYTPVSPLTDCNMNFQKKCVNDKLNYKLVCINEIKKVKCMNGGIINHSNIRDRKYTIDCNFWCWWWQG